ncbi:stage V sporulation protein S [uncultured Deinococcus sp.]|uniref:stage V sporulation protein S n=1 Tax=uncultured Deinococcus sp. TaxID=158789 RepID=UPI0025D9E436|nr:stage V sporulation protein S [uncultured Deinococcus sp.]
MTPDSIPHLEILRVSGTSRPNAIAGAVAALLRSQGQVDIQAIGPTAVNQTVKALAIARGYLVDDRLDLYAQPEFVKLDVQQEERTAVRFHVRSMPRPVL